MECTQKNLPDYTLVPFSPIKWRRLQKERKRIAHELDEALPRVNRLHKQMRLLEERSVKIVDNEEANIADAEAKEQMAELFPDVLPFDVLSE